MARIFTGDPEDPQWENAGRVHDWRNYINEDLQAIWHTFTPEQRRVIAESAQDTADAEQWD